MHFMNYYHTWKLRFSSPSYEGGFHILYLKITIFNPQLRTLISLKNCDIRAPAAKIDLAKMICLPRILHLTLPNCYTCHEIYTWPYENTTPTTKSKLNLVKILRLPRNLHLTLRKCYAYHEIYNYETVISTTKSIFNLTKILYLI